MPALLVLVALVSSACDVPRPHAALELARDQACACKDMTCATAAESALNAAIAQSRVRDVETPRRPPARRIIADARTCMTAVWRESQPAELFTAEADPPGTASSPCHSFLASAEKLLRCDRTPLAVRTRAAKDVLELRGKWPENYGTAATRTLELELYDRCLAALSGTLGAEDCSRGD